MEAKEAVMAAREVIVAAWEEEVLVPLGVEA